MFLRYIYVVATPFFFILLSIIPLYGYTIWFIASGFYWNFVKLGEHWNLNKIEFSGL